MWSIPFVEWKQLALPTFGCAKSSSSLYISSRASGKGHCGVHCLGASPGQVAGSFLSASQHNYKNCVPRATWWDAGMEEGYVNHHEAARLGSCTHHKTLHPETQRNSMRRNEVNEEWTNSEPVWFSVVVNGVKEMLWNLCLCTTSFPAILLQQWLWEADFLGALARVAVSSSACYRAQDQRAHTPTRALDYPEAHQLFTATLKCIRQNMAGLQFLGLLTWLFQVSVYFHFKVPGIAEAGCFGWTITQHKCKSKRAC